MNDGLKTSGRKANLKGSQPMSVCLETGAFARFFSKGRGKLTGELSQGDCGRLTASQQNDLNISS
jgi:hypothetical protein